MNYGLKVLDSAFEHLDIKAGNSDSEDEEVTDKVEAILEPKVGLQSGRRFNLQSKGMCVSFKFSLVGSLRGQTPPVFNWFASFHGTRRCWTW